MHAGIYKLAIASTTNQRGGHHRLIIGQAPHSTTLDEEAIDDGTGTVVPGCSPRMRVNGGANTRRTKRKDEEEEQEARFHFFILPV